MSKLKVEWTGSHPCLCYGEWKIEYDGIDLRFPSEIKRSHMNTFGEYEEWHFDENMIEQFESYEDGLKCHEWIYENREWITKMFEENNIKVTEELLIDLFNKIQSEDWRHGSCGGCI